MDRKLNWLNAQIDRMQADTGIARSLAGVAYELDENDIQLLQMAARMRATRPEAAKPTTIFRATLLDRMMRVIEGEDKSDPPAPRPRIARL